MRKLHLDLDALAVDSFATAPGADRRGTVHGADGIIIEDEIVLQPALTLRDSCMIDVCANSWQSGCLTCQVSCFGSCDCLTPRCGETDGCTAYTCPSGGKVCCA